MTDQRPAHSRLGGSGAARWMRCPGSVGLSEGVDDEEDDTFSAPGTAAHSLAQTCLVNDTNAWEYVGWAYSKDLEVHWTPTQVGKVYTQATADDLVWFDKEMADAVQVYLDAVCDTHPYRNQGNFWVERRFACPSIHPDFYGTADAVYLDWPNTAALAGGTLHVWDYKHGAGIVVDVERNAQLMYYACGALEDLGLWETVDRVVLHVVQPRGWHFDGAHRAWSISTDELLAWLEDELVPAMERATASRDTASGEHCRFCPARGRACPQVLADIQEMEELMTAEKLTNDQLGRLMELFEVAKIANKAHRSDAYARMNGGAEVPGWKLVKARANREWKEGAEEALVEKFGRKRAFEEPKLKSPAQIEKLAGGKDLAVKHAFKPDTGLQVVAAGDARPGISRDTKSLFKPVPRKRGRR